MLKDVKMKENSLYFYKRPQQPCVIFMGHPVKYNGHNYFKLFDLV